ncbi:MAG TPA: 23S rRNA (uracil(1939)-C(5))-methyltransferase RlmD [Oscillospiraceae bacterium]|nr:23S rRNA (uracil(1939)-C(5))-methyltransferase RlmD [Oscillospiraceae bacterium]
MLNKNDIVTIEITGTTSEGNGVGKYDGMAIFVPLSAIGDKLNVKITKVLKSYCFGIIESIILPSPDRIEEDCPVFLKCGGCSFRHISYESELNIKSDFIKDSFKKIGKFDLSYEDILGCTETEHYRNKAQYPVAQQDGQAVCGFYSKRSHRVIPFTGCKLQPAVFRDIVDFIMNYINLNKISGYDEVSGAGILRHIYIRQGYHSKEIMLCFIVNKPCKELLIPLCEQLSKEFPEIKSFVMNINSQNTNVIMGEKNKTLLGKDCIYDIMCGNKISLSPHSFYQVNTEQAEKLYGIAAEYANLSGSETVMDLYCGAGTIGLSVADKARGILGVEVIPQAIENAKENALNNNITNADFICDDAGNAAKKLSETQKPDIVIVDPPRKGCDNNTLEAIIKMNPTKVIMISCNPATAARDCKFLSENGYEIERIRGVDLFPRTTHVETVVLLSKLHSDQHIDIELNTDELDLTSVESKATYDEIKAYAKEHSGLSVSSLYIAQVKEKCGIIERENYNKAKTEDAKQPKCPKDKEKAIIDALKYFKMI